MSAAGPSGATTASNSGSRPGIASGGMGSHRGHPVTVIVCTTLAELDQAAHAVTNPDVPMPPPARTGGETAVPMRDVIRMGADGIPTWRYSTTTANDPSTWAAKTASPPPTNASSATPPVAEPSLRRFRLDDAKRRGGLHHSRHPQSGPSQQFAVFGCGAFATTSDEQHLQIRPLAGEIAVVVG